MSKTASSRRRFSSVLNLFDFSAESAIGEIGNYSKYVYDNHWSVEQPSSEHPRVHARAKYYWDSGVGGSNTYWMLNSGLPTFKELRTRLYRA